MYEEFLKELNIENNGSSGIIVNIDNSEDFARFYALLSSSKLVKLDETASATSYENTVLTYRGKGFYVKLFANLDKDIYKLVIEKDN